MSLNPSESWVIVPIIVLVSFICIWFRKKLYEDNKESFLTKSIIPPLEVPITSIGFTTIPPHSRIRHCGLYKVTFATTGYDIFFMMTAPDIVERCVRHHQKIPYVIGSDKSVTAQNITNLGDDLLVYH